MSRPTRRFPLWPVAVAYFVLAGLFVSIALSQSVIASDAELFNERVTEILRGRWPYFDALYEHLPLALPPMLLPKVLPGSEQFLTYALGFGSLMTLALIACGFWVGKLGDAVGEPRATMRWLAASWPLIPLVAFRVDPLSLLLTLVAVYGLFVRNEARGGWAALGGIAAKGWPVVIAPVAWWAGRKRVAMTIVGFTVILIAILIATPGFQGGRSFSGVHLETVTGSVLVWVRSLVGAETGIGTAAGAAYVAAPAVVTGLGVLPATALLVLTRSIWRRPFTPRTALQLMGVATLALLLASPLMSAQFLLWLTPWLVFFENDRLSRLFLWAGVFTLPLLLHWAPFDFLWQSGLLVRNLLILAIAAELVRHIRHEVGAAAPALV